MRNTPLSDMRNGLLRHVKTVDRFAHHLLDACDLFASVLPPMPLPSAPFSAGS
jgi:hypothetical protein